MPNPSWTELLVAALAHDISNFAHSLASAQGLLRAGAGESSELAEWAEFVENDVDRLRKLGLRLRALATAEIRSSARLDDACAAAVAEVDPGGGQVRRAGSSLADARARGTALAVRTAIVSLLEHALAAGPAGAAIDLAVRRAPGGPAIVEIAAPEASAIGVIAREKLETLLDAALRDRRGDLSLVLAGTVADALGGAVYVAADPKRGLVLELELVASSP